MRGGALNGNQRVRVRPSVHVVAALIERDDRILLDRRKGGHLDGCWEFPGGKREPEESDEQALERELREELGVASRIGLEIGRVRYDYDDFELTLVLYAADIQGEPRAIGVSEIAWFERRKLRDLRMPPADVPLLDAVEHLFDDTVT